MVSTVVWPLNTHRDQVVSADNPIFRPIILVLAPRKTTPVQDGSCVLITPTEPHHLQKADKLSLGYPSRTLFSPQMHTEILSMFTTDVLQTRPNLGWLCRPMLLISWIVSAVILVRITDVVAMRKLYNSSTGLIRNNSLLLCSNTEGFFFLLVQIHPIRLQALNLLYVCSSCKWHQKGDQRWKKN